MLLSAALLVLWLPASDSPKTISTDSPSALKAVPESVTTDPQPSRAALPDAPVPKADSTSEATAEPARPFANASIKPALERPVPTPTQKKLWYTFMAVGHGAAVFDAWSTRRAISANYGTESDPFLRPFSHSNAIYAATQVSPAVMDYLGRRMLSSTHPTLRRFWWVPQVAGAGVSFSSAIHNYLLVP